jgi:hypothetical protein
MPRLASGLAVAASVLTLLVPAVFAASASAIPFQGQVYCTTAGCSTSCAFACDSAGRPLTPFYVDGTSDPKCAANFNNPLIVFDSTTKAVLGRYIDNEVDGLGSFTNRQALVNCEDQQSRQLILVGEYPAETGANVQPTDAGGNGDTVGNMLEWYPYCKGRDYYGHKQTLPALGSMGPNGYMSQGVYVPPGCRSGATPTEQSSLWNTEWGNVDGSSFIYAPGATTIGDLLGTCEDSIC